MTNIIKNLAKTSRELMYARKKDKSLNVTVKVIDDKRDITEYSGKFTPDKRFLFIGDLGTIRIKPQVYRERGEDIVFITENTHKNIPYTKLKAITEAQNTECTYEIISENNKKQKIKIKDIKGTIDWNLFDNDLSPDFSSDANLITQSKTLREVLQDTPNIKLLLAMGISFFFGGCIGFFLEAIINLLYRMIQ